MCNPIPMPCVTHNICHMLSLSRRAFVHWDHELFTMLLPRLQVLVPLCCQYIVKNKQNALVSLTPTSSNVCTMLNMKESINVLYGPSCTCSLC